ncbi:MAG: type IV conjugative transfer system protein TraE [Pseudomonadota bacterium]
MKLQFLNNRLQDLSQQRNLLLSFLGLLAVVSVFQAIALVFKSDHVVIVPPELKQGYWVEKNRASQAYLEEMAVFFAHLVLDNSPSSASYNREVLLRYVLPSAYGQLKMQLLEDEKRLQKDHLATCFQASSVKVNPHTNVVELQGDLMGYVGNKRVSQTRDTYLLKLRLQKGRVFLAAFQLLRSAKSG